MAFRVQHAETSPDPLIRTYQGEGPFLGSSPAKSTLSVEKPRPSRTPVVTHKTMSPTRQQRTMIFSTPTKGPPTTNGASPSPWKIKVTVEAEPDTGTGNAAKNAKMMRTTTMKVPLKGEDEHTPIRRRGRPRKSLDVHQISTDTKASTRKETPRKRKTIDVEDNGDNAPAPTTGENSTDAGTTHEQLETNAKASSRPGRRSNISAQNIIPEAKTPAKTQPRRRSLRSAFANITPLHEKPETAGVLNRPEQNFTPFGANTSRTVDERSGAKRLRERVPTPRKPPGFDETTLSPLPPSSPPQFSNHASSLGTVLQEDGHDLPEDEVNMCDGGFDMIGDETAMLDKSLAESEGFSMVSIDTLKTHREQAEREVGITAGNSPSQRPEPMYTEEPQSLFSDVDGIECDPTPPGLDLRSPLQIPLAQIPPPKITAVIPLKALSPSPMQNIAIIDAHPSLSHENSRKRKPDNTQSPLGVAKFPKRRLSDSLSIGELLIRSAPGYVAQTASPSVPHLPAKALESPFGLQQLDYHTRLPTPADTADESSSPAPGKGTAHDSLQTQPLNSYPGTRITQQSQPVSNQGSFSRNADNQRQSIAQRLEVEYQREREEVIRHAREASKEQIINLDSDDEGAQPQPQPSMPTVTSGADIWLEEANSSMEDSMLSQTSRHQKHAAKSAREASKLAPDALKPVRERSLDLQELLEEDDQPRRGKIPRSWRRTSGHHFLYSDEVPSPERPPVSKALFDQDLELHISNTEQSEERTRSFERSPSPLKSILSSPLRRNESRSPKEVHFGKDRVREFDDGVGNDDQYYSESESSRSSYDEDGNEQVDATVYGREDDRGEEEGALPVNKSDVLHLNRQATQQLAAISAKVDVKATPKLSNVLQPKKQYSPLFGSWTPTAKRSLPANAEEKSPPRPSKRAKLTEETTPNPPKRTTGIFARLSSWLFPTKQVFNRNHYLVLDHHWRAAFPTPSDALDAAIAVHHLPDGEFLEEYSDKANNFPPDLSEMINSVIDGRDGIYSTPGMRVTSVHCAVAHKFLVEISERGMPLLCDGQLDGRKTEGYPVRDANGRVVRIKEVWKAWDVMARVYGLWVRDVRGALGENGQEWFN